jgi:hypothetical protein
VSRPRFVFDPLRDTVRAEDRDRAGRNFGKVLDEARALGAKTVDDVTVVHDFVADVDRGAKPGERSVDDFDRADDAGAKARGCARMIRMLVG